MSCDLAIKCDGVGKRYLLGTSASESLREFLLNRVRDPLGRRQTREAFWALRDIDFEVRQGEVVGLIGRNGAGKSTLLKVLSRITQPTVGTVDLYGRVGSLLEVGTGFHPELTGRENIFLNGSILGMTRRDIQGRFDEIVDFSGVERFLDTPVKRYSSGMFVRLTFAVAAHLEPEILIVDEVLAVGDVPFQKKCLGKMKDTAGSGRTVLFVSHQIAAVRALCSRAILLNKGGIEMDGNVEAVAQAYARAYMPEARAATLRPPASTATGLPRIVEARVLFDGQPDPRPLQGATMRVEVDFDADEPIEPALGVIVSNADGAALLHASTRYAPPAATPIERCRRGTIVFDFGRCPLNAGDYAVTLFLGREERDTHVLPEAIGFEVQEYDFLDVGRAYRTEHSQLWWPAKMSVIDRDVAGAAPAGAAA
jgi:lipopolysaccharide transport system ATP-binding protein